MTDHQPKFNGNLTRVIAWSALLVACFGFVGVVRNAIHIELALANAKEASLNSKDRFTLGDGRRQAEKARQAGYTHFPDPEHQ